MYLPNDVVRYNGTGNAMDAIKGMLVDNSRSEPRGGKIIAQVIPSFKRPFLSKSCLAGLVMKGQKA